MLPTAFYLPLPDGQLRPTWAASSPWDPRLQHGAPPSALLARTLERSLPRPDSRIGRIAFDFLGPLPLADVAVEAEVTRPGARIERSRARMSSGGRPVFEASAWRIAVQPGRAPAVASPEVAPPLPAQSDGPVQSFCGVPVSFGVGEALEWRFAEGSFDQFGPATVWARPRLPLVEGEETSPLCRLLLLVDSANGISAELPPDRYTFVPVELTVNLLRYPRTEWVGMRARTSIDADGLGLTRADLFDQEGPVGVAVQTLFVAPR
jgi:hypothetical protein